MRSNSKSDQVKDKVMSPEINNRTYMGQVIFLIDRNIPDIVKLFNYLYLLLIFFILITFTDVVRQAHGQEREVKIAIYQLFSLDGSTAYAKLN